MSLNSSPPKNTDSLFEEIILFSYFITIIGTYIWHLLNIDFEIINIFIALLFFTLIIPIIGWFARTDINRLLSILNINKNDRESLWEKSDIGFNLNGEDNNNLDKAMNYLYQFTLNSFIGFGIVVTIGFLLGFWMKSLIFTTLFLFLLSLGILHFALYTPDISKMDVKILNFKRNVIGKLSEIRLVLLTSTLISIILLVPRLPILFAFGGIGSSDTWHILSLAMNIVFTGKIQFINDFLGIFELLPSEKAVVAPLSFAIISIFSETSPLNFYFLFVIWLSFLGFVIFFQFVKLVFQNFEVEFTNVSFYIPFSATSIYFLLPYVGYRSISFFSGRTLYMIFFPLFLIFIWQLISKDSHTFMYVIKGILVVFFLLFCHRLSGLIIIPLILFSFIFKGISQMKNKSLGKILRDNPKILIILLYSGLLVLIGRFFLDLIFPPESMALLKEEIGWRSGTHFHLFIVQLPLIKEILGFFSLQQNNVILFYMRSLITMSFWMGIVSLLLLFDFVISPILVTQRYKVGKMSYPFLLFFIITELSLIPSLFFLVVFEYEYFFQAIIPIFVFHIIITGYLIYLFCNEKRFRIKSQFIQKSLNRVLFKSINKSHFTIFVLFILVFQTTFYQNFIIVDPLKKREEPIKQNITTEVIELVNFLKQHSDLTNATIINGVLDMGVPYFSYLGLRLSVLLPWIKFIPSYPSLYLAYGYLQNIPYEFPSLHDMIENIGDLSFTFFSGEKHKEEYSNLITKIYTLFYSNITSNIAKDLFQFFNAKMLIIPQFVIQENNLPLLYSSAINLYEPIFENRDFLVIYIPK